MSTVTNRKGQKATSTCPKLHLRKNAIKMSLGVVVGWGWLCLSSPFSSFDLSLPNSHPKFNTMCKYSKKLLKILSPQVFVVLRNLWAKREWGKLIALSQCTKNVSCIKGAAKGVSAISCCLHPKPTQIGMIRDYNTLILLNNCSYQSLFGLVNIKEVSLSLYTLLILHYGGISVLTHFFTSTPKCYSN